MPDIEWFFPLVVSGTIYDTDGSTALASTPVYLVDVTTDTLLATTTTDSAGAYQFDLSTFGGWSNRDDIIVIAGRLMARYVISNLTIQDTKDYRFLLDVQFTDNTIGNAKITNDGLNLARDWLRGNSTTTNKGLGWGIGTTDVAAADSRLELEQERNAFSAQSRLRANATYETILDYAEANGKSITKSGIMSLGYGGGSTTVTINTANPGAQASTITVD